MRKDYDCRSCPDILQYAGLTSDCCAGGCPPRQYLPIRTSRVSSKVQNNVVPVRCFRNGLCGAVTCTLRTGVRKRRSPLLCTARSGFHSARSRRLKTNCHSTGTSVLTTVRLNRIAPPGCGFCSTDSNYLPFHRCVGKLLKRFQSVAIAHTYPCQTLQRDKTPRDLPFTRLPEEEDKNVGYACLLLSAETDTQRTQRKGITGCESSSRCFQNLDERSKRAKVFQALRRSYSITVIIRFSLGSFTHAVRRSPSIRNDFLRRRRRVPIRVKYWRKNCSTSSNTSSSFIRYFSFVACYRCCNFLSCCCCCGQASKAFCRVLQAEVEPMETTETDKGLQVFRARGKQKHRKTAAALAAVEAGEEAATPYTTDNSSVAMSAKQPNLPHSLYSHHKKIQFLAAFQTVFFLMFSVFFGSLGLRWRNLFVSAAEPAPSHTSLSNSLMPHQPQQLAIPLIGADISLLQQQSTLDPSQPTLLQQQIIQPPHQQDFRLLQKQHQWQNHQQRRLLLQQQRHLPIQQQPQQLLEAAKGYPVQHTPYIVGVSGPPAQTAYAFPQPPIATLYAPTTRQPAPTYTAVGSSSTLPHLRQQQHYLQHPQQHSHQQQQQPPPTQQPQQQVTLLQHQYYNNAHPSLSGATHGHVATQTPSVSPVLMQSADLPQSLIAASQSSPFVHTQLQQQQHHQQQQLLHHNQHMQMQQKNPVHPPQRFVSEDLLEPKNPVHLQQLQEPPVFRSQTDPWHASSSTVQTPLNELSSALLLSVSPLALQQQQPQFESRHQASPLPTLQHQHLLQQQAPGVATAAFPTNWHAGVSSDTLNSTSKEFLQQQQLQLQHVVVPQGQMYAPEQQRQPALQQAAASTTGGLLQVLLRALVDELLAGDMRTIAQLVDIVLQYLPDSQRKHLYSFLLKKASPHLQPHTETLAAPQQLDISGQQQQQLLRDEGPNREELLQRLQEALSLLQQQQQQQAAQSASSLDQQLLQMQGPQQPVLVEYALQQQRLQQSEALHNNNAQHVLLDTPFQHYVLKPAPQPQNQQLALTSEEEWLRLQQQQQLVGNSLQLSLPRGGGGAAANADDVTAAYSDPANSQHQQHFPPPPLLVLPVALEGQKQWQDAVDNAAAAPAAAFASKAPVVGTGASDNLLNHSGLSHCLSLPSCQRSRRNSSSDFKSRNSGGQDPSRSSRSEVEDDVVDAAEENQLLWEPRCGSDGNTYANACAFDVEACVRVAMQQPGLTKTHDGPCQSLEAPGQRKNKVQLQSAEVVVGATPPQSSPAAAQTHEESPAVAASEPQHATERVGVSTAAESPSAKVSQTAREAEKVKTRVKETRAPPSPGASDAVIEASSTHTEKTEAPKKSPLETLSAEEAKHEGSAAVAAPSPEMTGQFSSPSSAVSTTPQPGVPQQAQESSNSETSRNGAETSAKATPSDDKKTAVRERGATTDPDRASATTTSSTRTPGPTTTSSLMFTPPLLLPPLRLGLLNQSWGFGLGTNTSNSSSKNFSASTNSRSSSSSSVTQRNSNSSEATPKRWSSSSSSRAAPEQRGSAVSDQSTATTAAPPTATEFQRTTQNASTLETDAPATTTTAAPKAEAEKDKAQQKPLQADLHKNSEAFLKRLQQQQQPATSTTVESQRGEAQSSSANEQFLGISAATGNAAVGSSSSSSSNDSDSFGLLSLAESAAADSESFITTDAPGDESRSEAVDHSVHPVVNSSSVDVYATANNHSELSSSRLFESSTEEAAIPSSFPEKGEVSSANRVQVTENRSFDDARVETNERNHSNNESSHTPDSDIPPTHAGQSLFLTVRQGSTESGRDSVKGSTVEENDLRSSSSRNSNDSSPPDYPLTQSSAETAEDRDKSSSDTSSFFLTPRESVGEALINRLSALLKGHRVPGEGAAVEEAVRDAELAVQRKREQAEQPLSRTAAATTGQGEEAEAEKMRSLDGERSAQEEVVTPADAEAEVKLERLKQQALRDSPQRVSVQKLLHQRAKMQQLQQLEQLEQLAEHGQLSETSRKQLLESLLRTDVVADRENGNFSSAATDMQAQLKEVEQLVEDPKAFLHSLSDVSSISALLEERTKLNLKYSLLKQLHQRLPGQNTEDQPPKPDFPDGEQSPQKREKQIQLSSPEQSTTAGPLPSTIGVRQHPLESEQHGHPFNSGLHPATDSLVSQMSQPVLQQQQPLYRHQPLLHLDSTLGYHESAAGPQHNLAPNPQQQRQHYLQVEEAVPLLACRQQGAEATPESVCHLLNTHVNRPEGLPSYYLEHELLQSSAALQLIVPDLNGTNASSLLYNTGTSTSHLLPAAATLVAASNTALDPKKSSSTSSAVASPSTTHSVKKAATPSVAATSLQQMPNFTAPSLEPYSADSVSETVVRPVAACNFLCPVAGAVVVCGSDGQTYASECEMHAYACMRQDADLFVRHVGACSSSSSSSGGNNSSRDTSPAPLQSEGRTEVAAVFDRSQNASNYIISTADKVKFADGATGKSSSSTDSRNGSSFSSGSNTVGFSRSTNDLEDDGLLKSDSGDDDNEVSLELQGITQIIGNEAEMSAGPRLYNGLTLQQQQKHHHNWKHSRDTTRTKFPSTSNSTKNTHSPWFVGIAAPGPLSLTTGNSYDENSGSRSVEPPKVTANHNNSFSNNNYAESSRYVNNDKLPKLPPPTLQHETKMMDPLPVGIANNFVESHNTSLTTTAPDGLHLPRSERTAAQQPHQQQYDNELHIREPTREEELNGKMFQSRQQTVAQTAATTALADSNISRANFGEHFDFESHMMRLKDLIDRDDYSGLSDDDET